MREQHPIALHYYEHSAQKKSGKSVKIFAWNCLIIAPYFWKFLRMKQLAGTEEIT